MKTWLMVSLMSATFALTSVVANEPAQQPGHEPAAVDHAEPVQAGHPGAKAAKVAKPKKAAKKGAKPADQHEEHAAPAEHPAH